MKLPKSIQKTTHWIGKLRINVTYIATWYGGCLLIVQIKSLLGEAGFSGFNVSNIIKKSLTDQQGYIINKQNRITTLISQIGTLKYLYSLDNIVDFNIGT